jgi:hypothetical protein
MNTSTNSSQPIYVTCAHWKDVPYSKVSACVKLGKYLDERIAMSNFGPGLDSIWFVTLIMLPQDRIHINEMILRRKTKMLEVYWRMDYERALAASLPAFREYLLEFFLATMNQAFEVKKVKDFDRAGFLAALEKEGKAWLKFAGEGA